MAESQKHVYRQKRVNHKGKQPKKETEKIPRSKRIEDEIEEITAQYEELRDLDPTEISAFSQFPLSRETRAGLEQAQFTQPTEIQCSSIPLALLGKDILGAARTGSGKTLAFVIPLLELLWRQRWSSEQGMAALIISPTRELAYQTCEVLKKVGKRHRFSIDLVIGGKSIEEEQQSIQHTNIVICTPGRLLQHMDETPFFNCYHLQILVLDEADRILDVAFKATIAGILENIPKERQTLLFSATQTKSVRDLARLSLKSPQYVAVHEQAASSTPSKLVQSYIVCELPQKLNILYSFIRSHLKMKILVFFSSCKQVKFAYEAFCRMRPGVPLLALYGKQRQVTRLDVYEKFCSRKSVVLLATDIAARGLDIPEIHWVVQVDCPEDANTYIHRVGRTARFEKGGEALLFLLPNEEEGMLKALEAKRVPISKIDVNPKKVNSIQKRLENLCAKELEMKNRAKRAVVSYMRSVFLQSDKSIFDMTKLPVDALSTSLGLYETPRIRFSKKAVKVMGKPANVMGNGDDDLDSVPSLLASCSRLAPVSESGDSDGSEELLTTKKVHTFDSIEDDNDTPLEEIPTRKRKPLSKVAVAKKKINCSTNSHIFFNDDEALALELLRSDH